MQVPDAAFNGAFSAGAAIASRPNRAGFFATLQSYLSQTPILLPIQSNDSYKRRLTFVAQVEKMLGYYEHDSVQSLLDGQEQQLRKLYERKLVNQLNSEKELRQQLQKLQLDYFSLQSQVQPQRGSGPNLNQVIQTLDSLNRMIAEIGRSLSAHITSDDVLATFGKHASGVTTLDALDLPALKAALGHTDGRPSLIISSDGRGMRIETFFDYSIRSLLCRHLVKSVFEPFHPKISPSLSQSLLATYKKLQEQEPQASAGKWRSGTFRSICDPDCPDTTKYDINPHLDKLINDQLKPLFKHVLGFDVELEEEHSALIRCVVTTAWDWNSKLKEGYLGYEDFSLTAFRHPCRLNPELMEEFESKPGS